MAIFLRFIRFSLLLGEKTGDSLPDCGSNSLYDVGGDVSWDDVGGRTAVIHNRNNERVFRILRGEETGECTV